MNSERELFLYELNGHGYHFKNTDWHDDWERFEDDQLNMAWEMWIASAQRQGYKLVPVDDANIMDMIYGKCPCGSSRSPIISDKEGYSLIHCFSCGANKYIHEDC